jgi:hypothetical protein
MAVEGFRLVVLGIDHQGENSDFRAQRSFHGVPQQRAAQLTPEISLVHRRRATRAEG